MKEIDEENSIDDPFTERIDLTKDKIPVGMEKRFSLSKGLKEISKIFLPTSWKELDDLCADMVRVTAIAAIGVGIFFMGRDTYRPKKVERLDDYVFVDDKHELLFDPNLSRWDPNIGRRYPEVYTAEKYKRSIKK